MKLFPYETFTIQTPDSIPVVRQKLTAQIESPKMMRLSRNHVVFEGQISESEFKISRIIHYRNSFAPNIHGRFEAVPGGTVVRVTMGINPLVIGFLCFWFFSWFSFAVPMALMSVLPGEIGWLFVVMPLLMLVIFWYAFWAEVQRNRAELQRILLGDAAIFKPSPRQFSQRTMQFLGTILAVSIVTWILTIVGKFNAEPESCKFDRSISPYCNLALVQIIKDNPGVSDIAIAPDNQTLVTGGADKAIKLWDLANGKLKQKFPSDSGAIRSIAISPDGQTVVSGSEDKIIRVWNLTTGKQKSILKGHNNTVSKLAISPDNKTLVSNAFYSSDIKVWDLVTGKLKHTLSPPPRTFDIGSIPIEHVDPEISSISITPDNQQAIGIDRERIRWWDLNSGKLQTTLDNGNRISRLLSLDKDDRATIANDSSYIQSINLKTGKIHKQMGKYFARLASLAPTIDRHYVMGIESYKKSSELKIWDLQTGKLLLNRPTSGRVVAVSPDRQTIVSASNDSIEIWR
jgi:WD40 repeat protein